MSTIFYYKYDLAVFYRGLERSDGSVKTSNQGVARPEVVPCSAWIAGPARGVRDVPAIRQRHVRRNLTTTHSAGAVRLPEVLGAPAHAGAVPADVARGDGRARLGSVRRDPRDRRRVRRPSELRHGDRR